MRPLLTVLMMLSIMSCSCQTTNAYRHLHADLTRFINDKDATIGVAVIVDGKDTVAVNRDRTFAMLSVYKFPIALAYADHCRNNGWDFNHIIRITKNDLHPDTYSPMTEKILADSMMVESLEVQAGDILGYMIMQSDNNASDIILNETGGAGYVMEYLRGLGIRGVNVRNTENEMHSDNLLCYTNSATPLAMAGLLDKFDREFNDPLSNEIKRMMETVMTGSGRLAGPIMPTNAVIGHKTGTGFTLPGGRLMAVNDVGYVHLPNGHRYTIAVFVENSGYGMERTEALIADISRIVFSSIR